MPGFWKEKAWLRRLGRNPILRVFGHSLQRAGEADILQAAASISYYTLFAIIPFLLIMVTISTMLAEDTDIQIQITSYFLALIPKMSQELIRTNLDKILDLRGTVRWISLLVFLWAATGTFSSIILNLDRAGNLKPHQYLFRSHLKGIAIMTSLAALLPVFFLTKGFIQIVQGLDLPFRSLQFVSEINPYLVLLLPYLVLFMVLSAVYHWGPNHEISWPPATISALLTTLLMKGTSGAFTQYLARGVSRYNVLYGTLGAVLALLFWLFLIMAILLYGAHLATTIERYRNGTLDSTGDP